MEIKTYEGHFEAKGAKIAICASRFNDFVVSHLQSGAIDTLLRHGLRQEDIQVFKTPGAFELPLLAQRLAKQNSFDGIIAVGAVIRGGTPHFDYVAGECTKGLAQVSLEYDVPMAFGVLTVDSIEQAIERSGTKAGNKGMEAALSLIEMISLFRQLPA